MRGRLAWGDHAEDVDRHRRLDRSPVGARRLHGVPGHAREPVPQRMARHPARRRLGHELLPPVPARCAQRGRAVDRALGAGAGACLRAPRHARTSTSRFRSSSAARASSGAARCSPRGRAGSRTATGCARPNGTSTCAASPWSTRRRTPCRSSTGPARCASRGGCGERAVTGWGFDERCRPWSRGDELARALRLTLEHAVTLERGAPGPARLPLPRGRGAGAPRRSSCRDRARPAAHSTLDVAARSPKAQSLADDLLVALSGRFRTR